MVRAARAVVGACPLSHGLVVCLALWAPALVAGAQVGDESGPVVDPDHASPGSGDERPPPAIGDDVGGGTIRAASPLADDAAAATDHPSGFADEDSHLPEEAPARGGAAPGRLRLSGQLGGRYTSNLYANASELADLIGGAALGLAGDWVPSESLLLVLDYRLEGEVHRRYVSDHGLGQDLRATCGVRPAEWLYLFLDLGGEHALVPGRPAYGMWGLFGRGGGRLELGEDSTLELGYGLRSDQFPAYDLDNLTQHLGLRLGLALGDDWELAVPVAGEHALYRERFVLDAAGVATGEHRQAWRGLAEPSLQWYAGHTLLVRLDLRASRVWSNDSYWYVGPLGAADPAYDAALIQHFDSHASAGGGLGLRWRPSGDLTLRASLAGGWRAYDQRPAYDALGRPTGVLQRDWWLAPSGALRWRLAEVVAVELEYRWWRQDSSDALWTFQAHDVRLALSTWYEQ